MSDINTTQRKNVFFLSLVQPFKYRKEKKSWAETWWLSPLNDIWGRGVLATVPSVRHIDEPATLSELIPFSFSMISEFLIVIWSIYALKNLKGSVSLNIARDSLSSFPNKIFLLSWPRFYGYASMSRTGSLEILVSCDIINKHIWVSASAVSVSSHRIWHPFTKETLLPSKGSYTMLSC